MGEQAIISPFSHFTYHTEPGSHLDAVDAGCSLDE